MDFMFLKKQFWTRIISIGLACATAVAVTFSLLAWLENPGGIFHDEEGTNWEFVFETGISWFVPTFMYVTFIVFIVCLLYWALKKVKDYILSN